MKTTPQQTHGADTTDLLHTKLAPPRLGAPLVARAALLDRLDAGLDRKLTLLSAPAGFGKTTLASVWIARRRVTQDVLPVAWVALDAGDNDPTRFWRYVLAAVQHDEDMPHIQHEQEALISARLLIMQGEAEAALRLLDHWRAEAQAAGRTRSVLEMCVVSVLAHSARADLPQAQQMLRSALLLAQPEGYVRLFLNEGRWMAALLTQSLEQSTPDNPLRSYMERLRAAFSHADTETRSNGDTEISNDTRKSISMGLIEPLSPKSNGSSSSLH